jgi:hypothetical protein
LSNNCLYKIKSSSLRSAVTMSDKISGIRNPTGLNLYGKIER